MTIRQPYTFDRVVRIIIAIILILAALWLVDTLSGVLLPFCVSCLIAYILEPLVQYNRRLFHLRGRILAIFLTLFEVLATIVIFGIIFIPRIINETQEMAVLFQEYASSQVSTPLLSDNVHQFIKEAIDFKQLSTMLTNQDLKNFIETVATLLSGGFDIVMSIINWCAVLLYVVFIMLDYERLMKGFRRMVPPRHRKIAYQIGNDIKTSMNQYFRGQALVAFLVGVLFSIGFLIVGLPLAIVLGLFIGLLNMVPYLQFISIVPTTLLCLVCSVEQGVDFWVLWWQCIAVYTVVQIIQDGYLVPKIMGKTMGLNPAIILLSLSIWGTLLGMIGLIIALPLTTLLLSYYDRYVLCRKPDITPHTPPVSRD